MSVNHSDHKSHAPTDEVASGRHRINGCAIGARRGAAWRPDEPFTPDNWSAPDTAEVQRVVAGRFIRPDADST
jgi:hypothetical protein